MAKTRKPTQQRKAQIVEAAMHLAAELGPDRMTTQKLADAVGITQAAVFRHFSSKAQIWQAVANRIKDSLPVESKLADGPALDHLRAVVEQQFRFIIQTPSIPAILYSRELHAENEALRRQFSELIDLRQALFIRLFQAAIDEGALQKALCAETAARLVIAFMQGLAMRWSLEAQRFDLVEEGMRLLDLQIKGYAA